MDNKLHLETQRQFDAWRDQIDWHDSYLKEAFLHFPTYNSKDGGIYGYQCAPDMLVLIVTCDTAWPAIELRFQGVEQIQLSAIHEIEPIAEYCSWRAKIALNGFASETIWTEKLFASKVDSACTGFGSRYGKSGLFSYEGDHIG